MYICVCVSVSVHVCVDVREYVCVKVVRKGERERTHGGLRGT